MTTPTQTCTTCDAVEIEIDNLRAGIEGLVQALDTGRADGTIYTYGQVQQRLRALLAEDEGGVGE